MSRSGYSYDYEYLALYRANVGRAIRGKRGQNLLREMAQALDAMPDKRLVAGDLVSDEGVCPLGAAGEARGLDMTKLDPECPEEVATAFGVARPLVAEVVFENDEASPGNETPEHRWQRMRAWVGRHLREGGGAP